MSVTAGLLLAATALHAQNLKPGPAYVVITRDGRRALPSVMAGDQEMLRLDDLAGVFQLTVREDRASNALTITRAGRTVVLSLDQGLASIGGRLVSLAAPPAREGNRWVVPAEFVSRALSLISDTRLELRKSTRLIIVGDLRVPRVTIRFEQAGPATRVTLDVSPGATYTVSQESHRLLVKLDAEALEPGLAGPASFGLVESVGTIEPATVALALAPGFGWFRASMVPLDAGTSRVLIDVLPVGAPLPPSPPPQAPQPPSQPSQAAGETLPPLVQSATPSIRTIVLDPGHGGEEIGAKGLNGAMEKDLTLDVARRLKSVIEAKLGVRVLLTREDDRLVPLDDRASIANNNKADLLISIHVNAAPRRDARGAEVFYLSLDGLSAESRRMAENPQGKTLPALGGGSRDIELILWETAQARHLAESAVFAGMVEEELRRNVEMSLRPIQQAAFRVLVAANMPAVLVEIGFVSNPEQETQLVSDAFKNQVVQSLYDAVVRYRTRISGDRDGRH